MFSCFFGLKNVFPTVKILTFSRGEFKYVQMDQGQSELVGKTPNHAHFFKFPHKLSAQICIGKMKNSLQVN
jgi:hypothetical protein